MITSTWSMWHIFAFVLSVGFIFLSYYVIRLIIQLTKTLKTLEETMAQIQSEVSPVISNVEGITENFEQITGRADDIFENVQTKAVDTMSVVDNLKNSTDIVKHTLLVFISGFLKYFKAWGAGFKAGILYFKEAEESLSDDKSVNTFSPVPAEIVDHIESNVLKAK